MSALQPELDFTAPAPAAVGPDRLADLIATLRGRGWLTRQQLEQLGFGERELRKLVEQDERAEILSYPGSPGYRLFAEATLPEIRRADALKSQARPMLRRWLRYQRRLHARGQPLPTA